MLLLKKVGLDQHLEDNGVLSKDYPWSLAQILDKEYLGSSKYLQAVVPKKAHVSRLLTAADKLESNDITEDCIILENYSGRQLTL